MAMWGITEDRRRAEVEAAAAIGPAEELAEAMAAPESLGDDRLEFQIMTQAGHLSAAMCRLLLLVAEYDRREAYGRWECRSMAHWLEWKCGLAAATAREHVRVARAIAALPVIREAFSRAELSYSKVRALTRVATVETEQRHRDRCRQPAAGAAAAGRPVALTPLLLAGLLRPTREPGPLAAWLPPHRIAVTMHLDAEAARQLHNRLHAVLGGTEAQSLMERLENLASRSRHRCPRSTALRRDRQPRHPAPRRGGEFAA